MSSEAKPARVLYENLDTSFVNLWALLRYLSQRSFLGRVHVELENYSADVFVNGSETPLVHEIDREAGTDVVEEAALHRLVLRVREASGSITVFEGAEESIPPQDTSPPPAHLSAENVPAPEPPGATPESMRSSAEKDDEAETVVAASTATTQVAGAGAQDEIMSVSGELISTVEQAATSLGADFASLFRAARISLADDYPFLDPMAEQLRYENAQVAMNGRSLPPGYVTGVSEALRRVVDQLAMGERARRTRERIALELSRLARKNSEALARSGFKEQLDRIAGTKVL